MTLLASRPFAAVLFDLDGTLVLSWPVVRRSWQRVFEEFCFPADATVRHGVPAPEMIASYLADRPAAVRQAAVERIIALEENDTDGLVVVPGAVAALDVLAGSGRCAIVTSCTAGLARVRLTATRLPTPDALVTFDDVAKGKPAPDAFLAGAAALGVPPEDCLVVEDAPAGITAGHAAGATVLAVSTTHAADELAADAVVPDLAAVQFTLSPDGVRVDAG